MKPILGDLYNLTLKEIIGMEGEEETRSNTIYKKINTNIHNITVLLINLSDIKLPDNILNTKLIDFPDITENIEIEYNSVTMTRFIVNENIIQINIIKIGE